MTPKPEKKTASRRKRPGKTVQVGFRLPEWLVQIIDRFVSPNLDKIAGRKLSRTEVATNLLVRGVDPFLIQEILAGNYVLAMKTLSEATEGNTTSAPGDGDRTTHAIETLHTIETARAWMNQQDPTWGAAYFDEQVEKARKRHLGEKTRTSK